MKLSALEILIMSPNAIDHDKELANNDRVEVFGLFQVDQMYSFLRFLVNMTYILSKMMQTKNQSTIFAANFSGIKIVNKTQWFMVFIHYSRTILFTMCIRFISLPFTLSFSFFNNHCQFGPCAVIIH